MERDDVRVMIGRLEAGAGSYACGGYLACRGDLQRTELLTALLFDRLKRKIRRVDALRGEADDNWNQTFYLLYFRTLGDRQNQEAYLSLARRVPYRTVLRERLAPQAVEAMLFGASGLLALYRHDAYTLDLGRHFEYLSAKYGIEAMDASEWTLADIRPANHPALRIAQAARFFAQDEFVMARAMACRTEEDIRRLFCIEASPYWRTHYVPGAAGDEFPKRLGAFKARIIGINLVAVLQFAYGSRTGDERLRDSALSLLKEASENQDVDAETASEAAKSIETLASYTLSEAQIENMVTAKGYEDCVVFMSEDGVSVVVSTGEEGLQTEDIARITDIVKQETGLSAESIKIMEVN